MNETSIINMAGGAVIECLDIEVGKVLQNLMDPNTPATAKRSLRLDIEFKADEDRCNFSVTYHTSSKLAPRNPLRTRMTTVEDHETGEFYAVEHTPNLPGQLALGGREQDAPKILRVKFG